MRFIMTLQFCPFAQGAIARDFIMLDGLARCN
jgi:hypothetical protein